MKVTELIKILQGVDGELEIVIPGYENGYDPINRTEEIMVDELGGGWMEGKYSTCVKKATKTRKVFALGEARD